MSACWVPAKPEVAFTEGHADTNDPTRTLALGAAWAYALIGAGLFGLGLSSGEEARELTGEALGKVA